MTDPQENLTVLLRAWTRGEPGAQQELLPLVYRELRRQAAACLRRERADHTLQPTALVHEAYLRLVGQRVQWRSRTQFFALAARMMRRVLVDHARARLARKRAAGGIRVPLDEPLEAVQPRGWDLLLLDRSLTELAEIDARQAHIVDLRYFGGLSEDEIATLLGVSRSTVAREWRSARAWLYRRMTTGRPRGEA